MNNRGIFLPVSMNILEQELLKFRLELLKFQ
ncbi:hypothetical protein O206_04435 [Ochrobactrum sp. EGD-AQ16]|uniref:Uncharacterized protein n=1 Tax=Brucella intermedia 229E TaxID=1337887 RepID=U4VF09_9HYPH|nr:hypothetical protein O206_04435 [Ochrobactrum sp. EGD-AQ16]ERM03708.1 hypothetical protein Q644_00195 [Brucella intermedia 229E]